MSWDVLIFHAINGFAGHEATDCLIADIEANHLIKSGVPMALLWYQWFSAGGDQARRRRIVVCTVIGALAALAVNRGLAAALPFRTRPMYAPDVGFHPLSFAFTPDLENWSSFPSDHAAFFFALSAGFYLLSRPLGLFVALWSLIVVCLPRIYLGVHYPSDIAAGAAIGVATAALFHGETVQSWASRWIVVQSDRAPGAFHALAFAVTFEMAQMFDDVRRALHAAKRILAPEGGASHAELTVVAATVAVLAALAIVIWLHRRRVAPPAKPGTPDPGAI